MDAWVDMQPYKVLYGELTTASLLLIESLLILLTFYSFSKLNVIGKIKEQIK